MGYPAFNPEVAAALVRGRRAVRSWWLDSRPQEVISFRKQPGRRYGPPPTPHALREQTELRREAGV